MRFRKGKAGPEQQEGGYREQEKREKYIIGQGEQERRREQSFSQIRDYTLVQIYTRMRSLLSESMANIPYYSQNKGGFLEGSFEEVYQGYQSINIGQYSPFRVFCTPAFLFFTLFGSYSNKLDLLPDILGLSILAVLRQSSTYIGQ